MKSEMLSMQKNLAYPYYMLTRNYEWDLNTAVKDRKHFCSFALYWKNLLGKFLKSPKGVQRDMLRDESSCDGGSIVEKLESFVQGMYTVCCVW